MKKFICILISLIMVLPLNAFATSYAINPNHSDKYQVAGFSNGGIAYTITSNYTFNDEIIGGYNIGILVKGDNITIDINNCQIYCWRGIVVEGSNVTINIADSKICTMTETAQQDVAGGYGSAIKFSTDCISGNILNIKNSTITNYSLPNIKNNDQVSALIEINSKCLSEINLENVIFSDPSQKAKWVFETEELTYKELETYVKSIINGNYTISGALYEYYRACYYMYDGNYVFAQTLQDAVNAVKDLADKQSHTIYLIVDNEEDISFNSGYFTINQNGFEFCGDVSFIGDEYNLNFEEQIDRDEPDLITYVTLTPTVYVKSIDGIERGYVTLEDAILSAKDGESIKVLEDTELSDTIIHSGHVYIDLNGKTLTLVGNINVKRDSILEFLGTGTLDGTGTLSGYGIFILNDIDMEYLVKVENGYYDRDITNYIDVYYYDCKVADNGYYTPYLLDLPEESTHRTKIKPYRNTDTNTGKTYKTSVKPVGKSGNVTFDPFNSDSNVYSDVKVSGYQLTFEYIDYPAFNANPSRKDMYVDISSLDIEKTPYLIFNASVVEGIEKTMDDGETFTINSSDAKITFDKKSFSSLANDHGLGEMTIYYKAGKEKDVPKAYLDILNKENIVAEYELWAYGRGTNIDDLKEGTITIEVPFNGIDGKTYDVYTINRNEEVNKQLAKYENGYLTIQTNNINYMIVVQN